MHDTHLNKIPKAFVMPRQSDWWYCIGPALHSKPSTKWCYDFTSQHQAFQQQLVIYNRYGSLCIGQMFWLMLLHCSCDFKWKCHKMTFRFHQSQDQAFQEYLVIYKRARGFCNGQMFWKFGIYSSIRILPKDTEINSCRFNIPQSLFKDNPWS